MGTKIAGLRGRASSEVYPVSSDMLSFNLLTLHPKESVTVGESALLGPMF